MSERSVERNYRGRDGTWGSSDSDDDEEGLEDESEIETNLHNAVLRALERPDGSLPSQSDKCPETMLASLSELLTDSAGLKVSAIELEASETSLASSNSFSDDDEYAQSTELDVLDDLGFKFDSAGTGRTAPALQEVW